MRCASGRHEWMDPVSAQRCCNGYVRCLRGILDKPLLGEMPGGQVRVDGEALVSVWVSDSTFMTPALRAEMERLIEMEKRATAGTWRVEDRDGAHPPLIAEFVCDSKHPIVAMCNYYPAQRQANAEFIAALRNFFPRMVKMMKEQGDVDSTARK